MALMRACSTWPCGIWIEGPTRTAPDGTSFAWQHWSHTFEYALAAGPGDWREAGLAVAGQDYNAPLFAVPTGLHEGPLPATAALVTVEPAGAVLSALKPHGNPLAPQAGGVPASTGQPDPADGVTVRLRDAAGAGPAQARVGLFTGLAAARSATLIEDAAGEPVPLRDGHALAVVPPCGVATLAVTPLPWPGAPAAAAAASVPEPVQPVYARYWLHGKGPAPAGNLPVAVHLSPSRVSAGSGGDSPVTGRIVLTVACGPEPACGEITLYVPPGLDVTPAGPLRYDLPGLGHASWDLAVAAAPGSAAGHRFVAARICDRAGQRIEDATLVVTGDPAESGPVPEGLVAGEPDLAALEASLIALAGEVEVSLDVAELRLAPGQARPVTVRVASRVASEIRGEVQLLSPAGCWPLHGCWTAPFTAAAGATAAVAFPIAAPADVRPGQRLWVLAKVMYFGRARYTEPAEIIIGDPAGMRENGT
jgi:hypothetical protein